MESDAEAGLTRSEGRRFAFTLAGAFAVVALVATWRDRDTMARAAWILSAVLVFAGVAFPAQLGPAERVWMKFGLVLSRITSPLFLGVVYFVVFTPIGFFRRLAGKNSIAHSAVEGSYWKTRSAVDPEARRRGMERQF